MSTFAKALIETFTTMTNRRNQSIEVVLRAPEESVKPTKLLEVISPQLTNKNAKYHFTEQSLTQALNLAAMSDLRSGV